MTATVYLLLAILFSIGMVMVFPALGVLGFIGTAVGAVILFATSAKADAVAKREGTPAGTRAFAKVVLWLVGTAIVVLWIVSSGW